jgi:hypothetical protein
MTYDRFRLPRIGAAAAALTLLAVVTPGHALAVTHAKPSFPGAVRVSGTQLDWYLRYSHDTGSADDSFTFGLSTDTPVAGDWDGNGTVTPGVVRVSGTQLRWLLRNSNSSGAADLDFTYGLSSDAPIVGDWDGNGSTTPGITRDVSGQLQWHLRNSNSSGSANHSVTYGSATDTPVAGDWTGKTQTTIGVARLVSGQWNFLLRNTISGGSADITVVYGTTGMRPIVGDWTGQGVTTVGMVDGNSWKLRTSNTSGSANYTFGFGSSTDTAVAGNWALPREIGQTRMALWGWTTTTEWNCLDALWTAESNWNPLADNPSSSAYGIPQSLPGSKMATVDADYLTDPTTQITWGLGYIDDVYGTPCSARTHQINYGWY